MAASGEEEKSRWTVISTSSIDPSCEAAGIVAPKTGESSVHRSFFLDSRTAASESMRRRNSRCNTRRWLRAAQIQERLKHSRLQLILHTGRWSGSCTVD